MQLGTQPCSPRARSRLRRPFGRNPGLRDYEPRDAEATVLHQLLSEHLLTFLERARDDDGGAGLPPFVVRELRGFLDCGVLAKGFARLRCDDCAFERLVPFSCKGRGFCPSCGGRRMTERAAHLVDAVLPDVPLRQWVLSLPHPIRALCAFDHRLSLKVLRIFTRALLTFQRRRAERAGIAGGRGGGVTVIQRFGGDLRLNLHFHNLTLDGVYHRTESGQLAFHPLPPPSDEEVARLLAKVRRRVLRLLQREGLLDEELLPTEAPHGGPSSALAALASASLRGLRALGPHAGTPILRIGRDPDAPWVKSRGPLQAHLDGFDLHAAVSIQRGDPEGREALARYLLRPAVAQDRLELLPNGDVQLELKTPWRDGTTHLCFEPLELIGRLASLVPRPRKNTLIYHGVLAARAKWRPEVVPGTSPSTAAPCAHGASHDAAVTRACAAQPATTRVAAATPVAKPPRRHPRWAELMRRAFGIDVLECPRCFGRLRLIATIESPAAVVAILDHLGLPTRLPRLTPSRAPPTLPSAPTQWLDGVDPVDPDPSWS